MCVGRMLRGGDDSAYKLSSKGNVWLWSKLTQTQPETQESPPNSQEHPASPAPLTPAAPTPLASPGSPAAGSPAAPTPLTVAGSPTTPAAPTPPGTPLAGVPDPPSPLHVGCAAPPPIDPNARSRSPRPTGRARYAAFQRDHAGYWKGGRARCPYPGGSPLCPICIRFTERTDARGGTEAALAIGSLAANARRVVADSVGDDDNEIDAVDVPQEAAQTKKVSMD
jgi:hypothetical protein